LSQLSREYQVSHSAIAKWRQAYQSKGEAAFRSAAPESQEPTIAALQARVAELERFCGQLALENDVLKKALHLLPSHSGTS
jgi:transposase